MTHLNNDGHTSKVVQSKFAVMLSDLKAMHNRCHGLALSIPYRHEFCTTYRSFPWSTLFSKMQHMTVGYVFSETDKVPVGFCLNDFDSKILCFLLPKHLEAASDAFFTLLCMENTFNKLPIGSKSCIFKNLRSCRFLRSEVPEMIFNAMNKCSFEHFVRHLTLDDVFTGRPPSLYHTHEKKIAYLTLEQLSLVVGAAVGHYKHGSSGELVTYVVYQRLLKSSKQWTALIALLSRPEFELKPDPQDSLLLINVLASRLLTGFMSAHVNHWQKNSTLECSILCSLQCPVAREQFSAGRLMHVLANESRRLRLLQCQPLHFLSLISLEESFPMYVRWGFAEPGDNSKTSKAQRFAVDLVHSLWQSSKRQGYIEREDSRVLNIVRIYQKKCFGKPHFKNPWLRAHVVQALELTQKYCLQTEYRESPWYGKPREIQSTVWRMLQE